MSLFQYNGLQNLNGLKGLNAREQNFWRNQNKAKLLGKSEEYANGLYRNQMYIHLFGLKKFKNTSGFERNQELDDYIINQTFKSKYKPSKGNKGLGNLYDEYNRMDTQAKRELLESSYKTDAEIEKDPKYQPAESKPKRAWWDVNLASPTTGTMGQTEIGKANYNIGVEDAKRRFKQHNQDILNKVQHGYYERNQDKNRPIINYIKNELLKNPEEVKRTFDESTDTKKGPGNNYFNAYKNRKEGKISVEDMAEYLAEQQVAYSTMNPEDAYTYLSNYAKNYVSDHQSWWTKKMLGIKNIGISAGAYLAQSTTAGVGQLAALADDYMGGGAEVWIDTFGNVYSDSQVSNGKAFNGNPVQKKFLTSQALYMKGKDKNGEDLDALFNVDYLEKAQRYNTFDSEAIKAAEENGGVSVYNTAAHVGEDEESFTMSAARMLSFGLVDVGMTAVGAGTGAAVGAGFKALGATGKIARGLAATGNFISKAAPVVNNIRSSTAIGLAYSKGVYDEALQGNLERNQELMQQKSIADMQKWIKDNPKDYNTALQKELKKLREEDKRRVKYENSRNAGKSDRDKNFAIPLTEADLKEQAELNIQKALVNNFYNSNINSAQSFENVTEAHRDAEVAAKASYITETLKYGAIVNTGWRGYLLRTPAKQTAYAMKSITPYFEEGVVNGSKKLIKKAWNKRNEILKATGTTAWGGAWTNYTDEMQSDFAVGMNNSFYDDYMSAQHDGRMTAKAYGDREWARALLLGLDEGFASAMKGSTLYAGVLGAVGSAFSANPLKLLHVPMMLQQKRKFIAETNKLYNEGKISEAEKNERLAMYDKSLIEKINDYISLGGIAETYYGNKNAYRHLGMIARQVNEQLDDVDYDILRQIYYSTDENLGTMLDSDLNKKDSKFIAAINQLRLLKMLKDASEMKNGEDTNYAAFLANSSVLKEATELMNAVRNAKDITVFSEEQRDKILKDFYAQNPDIEKNELNDGLAIDTAISNITKLIEVSDAIDKANKEIDEAVEKGIYKKPEDKIRNAIVWQKAFLNNNEQRADNMEEELSGHKDNKPTNENSRAYLLSYGDNADTHSVHIEAIDERISKLNKEKNDIHEDFVKAQQKYNDASIKAEDNSLSETDKKAAENELKEAESELESLKVQEELCDNVISKLKDKQRLLSQLEVFADSPLSVEEDIIGNKIDLENEKDLDAAVEAVKQLPSSDRARLLESYELAKAQQAEHERKEHPNWRPQTIFNERNFKVLDAIFGRIKNTTPEVLSKIKDVRTLRERNINTRKYLNYITGNPEAALHEILAQEEADIQHAKALWDKSIADWYKDATLKALTRMPEGFSDKVGTAEKVKMYQLLFNHMINTNTSILNYIINHPDEYKVIYNVAFEAKRFKEKIKDISESAYTIITNENPESTPEEVESKVSAIMNAILDNLDIDMPRAEDLIHALEVVANSELNNDYQIDNIMNMLVDIDNQRNSTFVSDAKKFINKKSRKDKYKKFSDQRELLQQLRNSLVELSNNPISDNSSETSETPVIEETQDRIPLSFPSSNEKSSNSMTEEEYNNLWNTIREKYKKSSEGASKPSVARYNELNAALQDGFITQEQFKELWENPNKYGQSNSLAETPLPNVSENTQSQKSLSEYKVGDTIKDKDGKEYEVTKSEDGKITINGITDKNDSKDLNKNEPETIEERISIGSTAGGGGHITWGKGFGTYTKTMKSTGRTVTVVTMPHDRRESIIGSKEKLVVNKEDGFWQLDFVPEGADRGGAYNIGIWREPTGTEIQAIENLLKSHTVSTFDAMAKAIDDILHSENTNSELTFKSTVLSSQEELNDFLGITPVESILNKPVEPIIPENTSESTNISIETLAQEAQQAGNGNVQIVTTLPPTVNTTQEVREVPNTLLGYVWSEYNYKGLLDKRAERKSPQRQGDALSKFQQWVDKEGIKLQNIVDYELGEILKINPDVNIHIMHVSGTAIKGGIDANVQDVMFNVIEATPEIKAVHNTENGGIIKGQDGKEYLIVGTTGYAGKNSPQFSEWVSMSDQIKQDHWNNSKESRFFISKYHTKVNRLKDGYEVRQLADDVREEVRPVTQLLADKKRNPKNLTLEDCVWGIQKYSMDGRSGLVTVNMGNRRFYAPIDEIGNAGNVFLFIEGASGTMIPVKMKSQYANDVGRSTTIGKRITRLVTELTDINHDIRYNALMKLNRLLFVTNQNRTRFDRTSGQEKIILIGDKNVNQLTFKTGDFTEYTVDLNNPYDINEVIQAFYKFNPRIQITPEMLSNTTTVEELAEAGALSTDIASLHTVGAEYFVNSMDSSGNPRDSYVEPNRTQITTRADSRPSVMYNSRTYYSTTDGKWQLQTAQGMEDVTDPIELKQIAYNEEIARREGQVPDCVAGINDYYVMKQGENPIVYSRHRKTNYVTELNSRDANSVLRLIQQKVEKENKNNAAIERNKALGENVEVDPNTGKAGERTSAEKKAQDIVKLIKTDSAKLDLTPDEHFYQDSQNHFYIRVTSAISATEYGSRFDPNSPWALPSSTIGNSMDAFVRDFFDDSLGDLNTLHERYSNASQESLMAFYNQLNDFKNNELKGKTVVGSGIKAIGKMNIKDADGNWHTVDIAGTVDLLAYDKDGNFYIYDMKTKHGAIRSSDHNKWINQLSLYKQFLEERYGIKVKSVGIIPIKVEYPTPLGYADGTTKYTATDNNTILADGKILDTKPSLMSLISEIPTKVNLQFEKLTDYEKSYIQKVEEQMRNEHKDLQSGVQDRKGKPMGELGNPGTPPTNTSKTFKEIFKEDPETIDAVIFAKFGNLGSDADIIEENLRKRGINTDNIQSIDSWLDYINSCK